MFLLTPKCVPLIYFLKIFKIYLERKIEGAERERNPDSPLSRANLGLHPRTLKSLPELKSRVSYLADLPAQVPLN